MRTQWAETIDKNRPFPEYPRPQMVRDNWLNLNGIWKYAVTDSAIIPDQMDGTILVPFSPETELSGVGIMIEPGDYLWYRRKVTLPYTMQNKRLVLHFGAVDQYARVWVNGMRAVEHLGGYLPFEADITEMVDGAELDILVMVTDDTDESWHTRGKQKTNRGQIWYTPQSGIWQTVWVEAVPENYIRKLKITPNEALTGVYVETEIFGEETCCAEFEGKQYPLPGLIPVENPVLWSPEQPKLYDFSVICGTDRVESYFALRSFAVDKDDKGIRRLFLNGKPYFHNGVLDQGYWPEGLYTPPCDEAMIWDIQTMKDCGFNMLRKHIKVEPLRWYYHCDRLGMLVWQDMPCGGGKYALPVVTFPLFTGIQLDDHHYRKFDRKEEAGRKEFTEELREMIRHLYNCPCIAMWVPFNEGWGQFDSKENTDEILKLDRTRTIDPSSGWHDQGFGAIRSHHVYFRKYHFKKDRKGRAVLLSEFGGYAYHIAEHSFNKKEFGYAKYRSPEALEKALEELYLEQIRPAVEKGLAAAVYTQVCDVEDEVNGLATYDRRILKISPERLKRIVTMEQNA